MTMIKVIVSHGGIKTLLKIRLKRSYCFILELFKPSIIGFYNEKVSQDLTQNMYLTCNVSGNPTPKVTWKHNGKPLDTKQISDIKICDALTVGIYHMKNTNGKLIICKLDFVLHAGTFECIATNKVSTTVKSMNLTIEAKPKIKDWEEQVNMGLTASESVDCITSANPIANVTWYSINKDNNTAYLYSHMYAEQLTFASVSNEHDGLYMCVATNKLGTVKKYLRVVVKAGQQVEKTSKGTIIGVVIAAVLVLLVALILILLYRRHLKRRYALYLKPDESFVLDKDRSLFDQCSELPYDMAWEFPRNRLTFIRSLGSGAFGQVWLAEAQGIHGFKPRDKSTSAVKRRESFQKSRRYQTIPKRYQEHTNMDEKTIVAVKTLKDGAAETEYKDLASELKILIHLGENKNIVNLLGACTTGGQLCVILECCPGGNLLNILRSKREIFQPIWSKQETDVENEFTYIDLVMIAYQVAKGMDFLQSKKCVHRDLAARNVLVGEGFVMKIADFGLARDIYKDDVYLKETTGLLPVKWMALESLFDKVYTSMSDIWSFGILLWETFTLGGSPYPGLPNEELFAYLEHGRRMDCPETCPKEIYEIMRDCWTKSPYERPLFSQIVDRLDNSMNQNVPSSFRW